MKKGDGGGAGLPADGEDPRDGADDQEEARTPGEDAAPEHPEALPAWKALLPEIYDQLHQIATRLFRAQSPDHTLQPTALVNEALLRLTHFQPSPEDAGRHFRRVAATVMRHVLIEHAKKKRGPTRSGGRRRVPFQEGMSVEQRDVHRVLAVEESMKKLERIDPEAAEVASLRYFAGHSLKEIAEILEVGEATVKRRWRRAKGYLGPWLEGLD